MELCPADPGRILLNELIRAELAGAGIRAEDRDAE